MTTEETQPAESNVYTTFTKDRIVRLTVGLVQRMFFTIVVVLLWRLTGAYGGEILCQTGKQYNFRYGSVVETNGHAYQYDFDKFIIDFAPGKDTTFQFVPMDTAGNEDTRTGSIPAPNGNFDNQSYYTSQLVLQFFRSFH